MSSAPSSQETSQIQFIEEFAIVLFVIKMAAQSRY